MKSPFPVQKPPLPDFVARHVKNKGEKLTGPRLVEAVWFHRYRLATARDTAALIAAFEANTSGKQIGK